MTRSYLFVPGDRPERFAKALAAGADAVIVDLEDAVAPAGKDAARAALRDWLDPARPVLVRINACNTPWHAEDLALAALPGVAGIVLPKAEQTSDIARLVDAGAPAVMPLIESALGMHHALELARSPRVARLLFGSIDFSLDLGMTEEIETLRPFRAQLVLVSRLAGIAAPVDGVTVAIDDLALLAADTDRARRQGFGGKLCIHPRQVATVNAAFAPGEQEVAWAGRVVQAADQAGGAAVAVDGRMVDRPVILQARAILEEHRRRQGG